MSTCLSFKSAFFKFDSRPIIAPKQESLSLMWKIKTSEFALSFILQYFSHCGWDLCSTQMWSCIYNTFYCKSSTTLVTAAVFKKIFFEERKKNNEKSFMRDDVVGRLFFHYESVENPLKIPSNNVKDLTRDKL